MLLCKTSAHSIAFIAFFRTSCHHWSRVPNWIARCPGQKVPCLSISDRSNPSGPWHLTLIVPWGKDPSCVLHPFSNREKWPNSFITDNLDTNLSFRVTSSPMFCIEMTKKFKVLANTKCWHFRFQHSQHLTMPHRLSVAGDATDRSSTSKTILDPMSLDKGWDDGTCLEVIKQIKFCRIPQSQ